MPVGPSNFAFLSQHDIQLVRLGALAERYFHDDPNTCLIKLRQFGELLAQLIAAKTGLLQPGEESQADLLRRLKFERLLPSQVADLFHEIRILGNRASHGAGGTTAEALNALKYARQAGIWFHRTYGKDPKFVAGPFQPPAAPEDAAAPIRAELDRLRAELLASKSAAERAQLHCRRACSRPTERRGTRSPRSRRSRDMGAIGSGCRAREADSVCAPRIVATDPQTASAPIFWNSSRPARKRPSRSTSTRPRRGRSSISSFAIEAGMRTLRRYATPPARDRPRAAPWRSPNGRPRRPGRLCSFRRTDAVLAWSRRSASTRMSPPQSTRRSATRADFRSTLAEPPADRGTRSACRSSSPPTVAPTSSRSKPRAASGSATLASRPITAAPLRLADAGRP